MELKSQIILLMQCHTFLKVGKPKKTEVKNNGKVIVQKQYLSPNNIMFKATLGVVEFLRLEGKLNPTEILEVAKSLKVGEKKLKRLFNNEPIANTTTEA